MKKSEIRKAYPENSSDPLYSITLKVNNQEITREVSPRRLLADFLRHELGLTGTHVGCEHGVCGCCTVIIDGSPARSCLTFAVQVDGADIRTVESLQNEDGSLHPLQEAFKKCHALQCGFCTPGFLMSIVSQLEQTKGDIDLSDDGIRVMLSGNLCRCTGYQNIVSAVRQAAEQKTRNK